MKKRPLLILLLLSLFFLFSYIVFKFRLFDKDDGLNYFLGKSTANLSLDPIHGDVLSNAVVFQHIIGTLVTQDDSLRYIPYLAQKYETVDNGKTFLFNIRSDVVSERGTKLNAKIFKNSIEANLRYQLKNKMKLGEWELLIGFNEFLNENTNEIKGISAPEDYVLALKFSKHPGSILKYLSMSRFGWYDVTEFKSDTFDLSNFRSSTGTFRIVNFSNDKLKVRRREERDIHKRQFNEINFFFGNNGHPNSDNLKYSIKLLRSPGEETVGFKSHIKGPPFILTGIALSNRRSIFNREDNRRYVQDKVFEFFSDSKNILPGLKRVPTFYIDSNFIPKRNGSHAKFISKETINIISSMVIRGKEFEIIKHLVHFMFPPNLYNVKWHAENRKEKDWLLKQQSYEHYDIRFFSVSTGASYINWVAKMMFCGTLGVGLPDPKKSICRLLEKDSNQQTFDDAKDLERILWDEAYIIPLYYYGISWEVTDDIDLEGYFPVNYYPRVDLLRRK